MKSAPTSWARRRSGFRRLPEASSPATRWRPPSDDIRRFERVRFNEAALWFSPDGRKLGLCAVPLSLNLAPEARGWQFWVLPMTGGEPVRRLQAWSEVAPRVSSFSWLPDSRHVVLGVMSPFTLGADNRSIPLKSAGTRCSSAWTTG